MKLLVINFVMDQDSPVLAWQHGVVTRLAARCERVVVLTERVGRCPLPSNVEVHRVPRAFTSPLRMLGVRALMNAPVWRWCARERFDAVFVHMNADWVYRLSPCWMQFRLPVLLWYAHGTVTPRLHRALARATCVVTSTPDGFRIPSPKVRVIGQGIDTDLFHIPAARSTNATIAAVGRVSRRKSVDLMIEALAWLKSHAPHAPWQLRIIGPALTADDATYREELDRLVKRRGLERDVHFEGPRPLPELPEVYHSAFAHLNLSDTGSMDKAILESLACGCPTLSSNVAIRSLLEPFPELILRSRAAADIGRQIAGLYARRQTLEPAALRALVAGQHDADSYIERVHQILRELSHRQTVTVGIPSVLPSA